MTDPDALSTLRKLGRRLQEPGSLWSQLSFIQNKTAPSATDSRVSYLSLEPKLRAGKALTVLRVPRARERSVSCSHFATNAGVCVERK